MAMYGKRWFGPRISSNIYQNLMILVSSDWQFSKLIFQLEGFMRFHNENLPV